MWVLLSSRLRRWLFMTVAIPVLGALARKLGDRLEQRRGTTRLSRGLHKVGDLTGRGRRTARKPTVT